MHPETPSTAYTGQGGRSAPPDSGDSALIVQMAEGDERALGVHYDRWEHTVRAVAVRIVTDVMEAEDVVEDVFWQAWRQAGRFDGSRGGAGTWLLTITRSRSLDRLRALKRSREDAGLDELVTGESLALEAPGTDPLEASELADRSMRVREAVALLPAEQREALELAYFEGLSQTEIAERTKLPLGTVKTRMRLALQKLRDRLGDLSVEAA